jgi:hypothetical protein
MWVLRQAWRLVADGEVLMSDDFADTALTGAPASAAAAGIAHVMVAMQIAATNGDIRRQQFVIGPVLSLWVYSAQYYAQYSI